MSVATVGIDLGKNSCSLAGLDGTGAVVLRHRFTRERLAAFRYAYTAMMIFPVFIEGINMVHRRRNMPVHLRNPYGEDIDAAGNERRALEEAGITPLRR